VLKAGPFPGIAKVCLAEKANTRWSFSAAACRIGIDKSRVYNTKSDVRVSVLFIR